MVARGKPAVVLGYKTTNGVKEPCVMLGLIAHRDMDTIDDLLDPAYAKKVKNEHNTTRLRTMGVKSVRFNLVEEIIPPSAWERYVRCLISGRNQGSVDTRVRGLSVSLSTELYP